MGPREVSVLIPTYNRAHVLVRTIDRALAQTYPHFHVLVVDDGSTDSTAAVLAERYGSDPRVRYLYKPNGGVSSARNFGLERATGDYLAFLDSDDVWEPWKLALQVACMERLASDGVGMIWTNLNTVDPEGRMIRPSSMRHGYSSYELIERHGLAMFEHSALLTDLAKGVTDPGSGTRVYWGDVFSRMVTGNLCQPSTVMLTRERAQKSGRFDETMKSGEDHAFHIAASRVGPVALLDIAAVNYCRGAEDQLTQPAYRLTIAQNYLRTILPVMERDRSRIDLPVAVLRETMADAYARIGEEMFNRKDNAGARRHIVRSLRERPWQPREWLMLAAASTPVRVTDRLRSAFRALKKLGKRAAV